jgi:glycosyltransferase involved in cell wall biosynthesis
MINIAIIIPHNMKGGPLTVFRKLKEGLLKEGLYVNIFEIGHGKPRMLSLIYNDLQNVKNLTKYDLVLYIGSIPWPSHMVIKILEIPTALFLHGFVYHELFYNMLYGKAKDRISSLILLTIFKTAVTFNTIDLYISSSLTVCEANKISKSFILLPNWISFNELSFLETISHNARLDTRASYKDKGKDNKIRIVAYTSYANSPRLLSINDLFELAYAIKRIVMKKFELIIIDPKKPLISSDSVKIVRPIPRQEFLSLLASADLYIERGIDEDLGQTILEAMAIGTPVAKITYPRYLNRADYVKNLIHATSLKEFSKKIAEYLNNRDYYYPYYSKSGKHYIQTKRTWDVVKAPLLAEIKKIAKRSR